MKNLYSIILRHIKSMRSPKIVLVGFASMLILNFPALAQDVSYTRPSLWIGVASAANLNFYRGSTQHLTTTLTAPVAWEKGFGAGLYLAPVIEYYRPKGVFGFMLQAGYDSRKGKFEEVLSPCNCPRDLKTNLAYATVEPSLRIAPFRNNFFLFAGPRLGYNIRKEFNYQQKPNPDYPDQVAEIEINDDFSSVNSLLISSQIGAGIDIPLSPQSKRTQMVLSTFASYHPYFGQDPRSVDTWNISTLRIGAALKIGRGQVVVIPAKIEDKKVDKANEPKVVFSVVSPANVPTEYRVRETFPIRNYVFFNVGSTDIPDRYVLLQKNQVKDFKEDQLEVYIPKRLSGRSSRQMIVYYNVLNILGDRMQKNLATTVVLVGSSEKGPDDGREMANSIKKYLVDVWGISTSRIAVEGRDKPRIPSEQSGATKDLELLREGDRRVSIESTSPDLLMEFQSGPNAPLKPIEINTVVEAPLNSYVSYKVAGARAAFISWSLQVRDEKGDIQYYGPFIDENLSIPGKSILGSKTTGDYKMTMVGVTKDGNIMYRDTTVHLVLWAPSTREQAMRYSVIYEFNDSKAISIYEKYLTEVLVPKIPKNGTVLIHGYTDIIGDEEYNQALSLARADDVRKIVETALIKSGRKDVNFEVVGFGENQRLSPFENNYPEERFYNRTVIIDIIPAK